MNEDIANLQSLRENINAMSKERKPRVLIVEDNNNDAEALHLQIQQQCLPMDVTICHDCETADELLRSKQYDLVLLDLLFPGMSGVDLLRSLGDTISKTNVIAISGLQNDAPLMKEALECGVFAVMSKPFSDQQIHGICGLV